MQGNNMNNLDHVGIFVDDLDNSRRFYETILGMNFVEKTEDEHVWMVTLKRGQQEFHLFKAKEGSPTPHINHLSFEVTSTEFESKILELGKSNVAISGPHFFQNTKFIKFKDPSGITWEWICK
jgi:catechol 2,3-dioxygenase-like lactoylglutathione lyase family enzyme